MAEHTSLKPASIPIHTKGNAFWHLEERFLIRGISYVANGLSTAGGGDRDLLAEDRLEELERDIKIFRELGLNTIQISRLEPHKNYEKALKLLEKAGIYVLVKVFEDIKAPVMLASEYDPDFDTAPYYPVNTLLATARVVDQIAEHPNVLGFIVSGDAISSTRVSKIAEVTRAAVADLKTFLRRRGGRTIPVGVGVQNTSINLHQLQYFTAGSDHDRVDFFTPDCWSWAQKFNFQTSGWEEMVAAYAKYPVPMFLTAYGAVTKGPRLWEELECLYSPAMTNVFSGGCLYTYFEDGNNDGIVRLDKCGQLEKKLEFELLKRRFEVVNKRKPHHLYSSYVRDYEKWSCEFPARIKHRWLATPQVPGFQVGWEDLLQELSDEKEWEVVDAP